MGSKVPISSEPEIVVLSRNKLLLLDPANSVKHEDVVKYMIGEQVGIIGSIIKGVKWKTKYYEVDFDIYVDSYNELQEWVKEFKSDEYTDLREILAGIILLFDNSTSIDVFNNMIESLKLQNERILVACNISDKNIEEDQLEALNNKLLGSGITVVNWSEEGVNSYGEKIGKDRMRELLDIHKWDDISLCSNNNTGVEQALPESLQCDESMPLESVISKMKEARERYIQMGDKEAAEDYALALSQELTEILLPSE
ncbi:Irc6p Ecym_2580 [Eremothecium cymbalariae DBVPG|uniref:Increased recombination centers protein 6 n=1 Tax=Eremothecium cymbalariae (strain CBS 270.75 / DBVPG 7215 / KCTC 17166 / NRRL Y-17582) TaxID=931890 RepID=G8JQG3_ERECY|nr:Hypothetical protein Ecym_2580 [Eremothecium cymbalariae DBVPG\